MKLIGIIMILLSGTGIGFKASDNLVLQNDRLKKLKKMIMILRGEIKYNNSYIAQALWNVSSRVSSPYKEFLKHVSKQLNDCPGRTLSEIWKEGIDETLSNVGLDKTHLVKFKELGDTLGYLDKEMQLSSFDLFLEQLDMDIGENNRKMKDNCKLYKCLGVMGGILVVLLIT